MSEGREEFLGTGRRKTSVARVRISAGSGNLIVNGKDINDYCYHEITLKEAISPLMTVNLAGKIDARIRVEGGGAHGQAGAIRLGIARALCEMDINLRPALKKAGHLTRDGRMKERKKPGQPGARRRFQFSKR